MENRYHFEASWELTQELYEKFVESNFELRPLLDFIKKYKTLLSKHIRIGTTLFTLILSRSDKHGLRLGQPRISIEPLYPKMNNYLISFSLGDLASSEKFERESLDTEIVSVLIDRLKTFPIS